MSHGWPWSESITLQRIRESDGRCAVYVDSVRVGLVIPSDRRWVKGWRVEYLDGKDLGDQPRRMDAVTALVAYATSPYRGSAHR